MTIESGTGTENDPYILAAVYGVRVIYDANGGMFAPAGDTSVTQYYAGQNAYAIPPAINPEAEGMLFLGWFTDQLNENKFDFDNTPITENITLNAG